MKQLLPLLCVFFICIACASNNNTPSASAPNTSSDDPQAEKSLDEQYKEGLFSSAPKPGTIVVIGIGALQSTDTKSIEDARADAARKLAFYHGVKGKATSGSSVTGNVTDSNWIVLSEITPLNSSDLYKGQLQYNPDKDVLKIDQVVMVRFTYITADAPSISIKSGPAKEKPEWAKKKENYKIPGFLTGIGQSGRQNRLRDTVMKSYESAIISLVSQIHGTQTGSGESTGTERSSTSSEWSSTEGGITHFLALETWIDQKTGEVWTLAVAPDPKQ